MRLLIAIAAPLVSVAVSAGELDGKAIICRLTETSSPFGFEFKDDRVIRWDIETYGTKAELTVDY